MSKTNVVIFARVSSDSDRQDYTRQINELQSLADSRGWTVVDIIAEKVAATKTRIEERQDLKRLFDVIDKKTVHKVLVSELTRIGRLSKQIQATIQQLKEKDVSLYIQSIDLDTGASGAFQQSVNNILITILSEFAQLETVRLSERIKSGLKQAVKDGKTIGRPKGSKEDIKEKIAKNEKYARASRALKQGLSLRQTSAYAEVSINTVRKIKNEIEL